MKLSSRAFNNIVIFAMLGMIMLFNLDAWLPKPSIHNKTRLINEQDMLLRIDMNDGRIERIGTDWRLVADKNVPVPLAGDAYNWVQQWQDAELTPVNAIPAIIESTEVKVWLAAQNKPAELTLERTASDTFVTIAEQHFRITNTDYTALIFLPKRKD